MADPVLRLHDGFAHTSPELRPAVRALQRGRGLTADGIVGAQTWRALHAISLDAPCGALATSYPADHPALGEDLEAATRYAAIITAAAAEHGFLPSLIAGLGSRESRWGLALRPAGASGTGDFTPRLRLQPHRSAALPPDGGGFGRGLLQIDYDSHAFARDGAWPDPEANIRYGCRVLAQVQALLRRRTMLSGPGLLRGALAAYNCGPGNVIRALRQGIDVDFYTAGRDYARDVLSRAGFFQLHGWD